jgi:Tol biopolymer transport system component
MNTKVTLVVSCFLWFLTLSPGVASATYPGQNGRIAFVQGPDIYTMNPDGSDVRQLTNLGPDSDSFWESWSPDGKQIVFNEYRPPDFRGQLWLMNADGSNQHLLLADADFNDESASFTPDGSSVIFTRCQLVRKDTCALYQIAVTGGDPTAIIDFELGIGEKNGKYSASGSLALISVDREGIICAIYRDSPSGLNRITPASLSAQQPDWSPDGETLAFATHCANPQNEEIWVVNAESKALRRLTRNGDDYFNGPHDFHPSWSPQGDAIVFQRGAPDRSSSDIVVMKADGSGSRRLLTLRPSAHMQRTSGNTMHESGRDVSRRRLQQIEEGGGLPQWGVATR